MRNKVEILKALAETNRIRILMMLNRKSLCVCEITSILNINTSTVSTHLSILKNAGYIIDEKQGKWTNYRINPEMNGFIKEIFELITSKFTDEKQIIDDAKKVDKVNRYEIVQFNMKA